MAKKPRRPRPVVVDSALVHPVFKWQCPKCNGWVYSDAVVVDEKDVHPNYANSLRRMYKLGPDDRFPDTTWTVPPAEGVCQDCDLVFFLFTSCEEAFGPVGR